MTDRDQFEYPDESGYPDGSGTLDEGTAGAGPDAADVAAADLEAFGEGDEEDDEGV